MFKKITLAVSLGRNEDGQRCNQMSKKISRFSMFVKKDNLSLLHLCWREARPVVISRQNNPQSNS